MKLTDQVISLDLAKRLKELGCKQESYFSWSNFDTTDSKHVLRAWKHEIMEDEYAAFTVAELGEKLKEANERLPYWNGHNYECRVPAPELEDGKRYLQGDTEAEARGLMLAYLIENNLLTV